MSLLWNEKNAAEATGGKAQGQWQAVRVEIDSRRVAAGDLFVALKGDRFDGHDYVAEALKKGAAAALVSRIPAGLDNAPLLLVEDTLRGLEQLGKYARARSQAKIVGVTGSVGKTSAKEMLRLALAAHGATYATTGNYNNHIGTPLNLANLPPDIPFAVYEMGMNHAGEIEHLTRMVRPHVAAITTVEAVHMEFFPSIEAIAHAKAEIFEGLSAGGTAVLNIDNPLYPVLVARAHQQGVKSMISFGAAPRADVRLIGYEPQAMGCRITASVFSRPMSFTLQAIGRHWAMTALLVLSVAHALGLDDAKTVEALAGFGELEGRGRMTAIPVSGGEAILIDDSYNASPASMRAAFAKTAEVWQGQGGSGRKLAALGDMLELGPQGPVLHAGLAEDLVKYGFDGVYTAGVLMCQLHETLPAELRAAHVMEAKALLPLLKTQLKPGDILLVKGSHGSRMYELAKMLLDVESSVATREKTNAL